MCLVHSRWSAVLTLAFVAGSAQAGYTEKSYIDGGQSADGRFVVTAQIVSGGQPYGPFQWRFTWKDTKQEKSHELDLKGLPTGMIYAHIFVAPDGETFAVWNPLTQYTSKGKLKHIGPVDSAQKTPDWRMQEEFSHRLVIFRKNGEIVKELGLLELLQPSEWGGVLPVFSRVQWLRPYDGMDYKKTPRSGYALFRISPDYTVLEFTTKGGRVMRVSLTDGTVLGEKEWSKEPAKTPVRPFQGDAEISGLGKGGQDMYVPSLDPVRSAGTLTKKPNK